MLSKTTRRSFQKILLFSLLFFQSEDVLCHHPVGCIQNNKAFQQSWRRINPTKWFSIAVPRTRYNVTHAADSNSATYTSNDLKINFIYWLQGNTPHFIQWARDNDARAGSDSNTRTILSKRIRTGSYRGVLTKYIKQSKKEYVIEIHFTHATVVESGTRGSGEFELSVTYFDRRNELIAERIIESLRLR